MCMLDDRVKKPQLTINFSQSGEARSSRIGVALTLRTELVRYAQKAISPIMIDQHGILHIKWLDRELRHGLFERRLHRPRDAIWLKNCLPSAGERDPIPHNLRLPLFVSPMLRPMWMVQAARSGTLNMHCVLYSPGRHVVPLKKLIKNARLNRVWSDLHSLDINRMVWNLIPKAAGKKMSDTRRGGSKGWAWDIAMYIFVLAKYVVVYRQHMTHAPTRIVSFRRSDTLLGRFSYQDGKPEMMVLDDVNLNVRDNILLLDAGLVGHCHGLFCLYFEDMTFGVWNPSLRELRRVQTRHVSNWAEIGFGYDHSSQDYKIVLVLDMRGSHSKALVLSLTSGESRMIDVPCLENTVVLIRMRLPGTLVGENIYWQVCDDKVKVTDKVLSFDLVSETFNYCPGPSNCGKAFPQVIEGLRGGESIGRESKLVAYNLEEKSLTNVETSLSLYTYGSTLLTYVETLVPIPGSFS
ncbi:hypothetical protein YC2023_030284 [Brassica napus]